VDGSGWGGLAWAESAPLTGLLTYTSETD